MVSLIGTSCTRYERCMPLYNAQCTTQRSVSHDGCKSQRRPQSDFPRTKETPPDEILTVVNDRPLSSGNHVHIQKYEVTFDYGPTELDRHNVVYKQLRELKVKSGVNMDDMKNPEYHFNFYIHSSESIINACFGVFDSEPKVKPSEPNSETSRRVHIIYARTCALENVEFLSECRKLLQIIPPDFLFFVLDEDKAQTATRRKVLDQIKVDQRRLIYPHQDKTAIYDKCYECLKANLSNLEKEIINKGSAIENSEQYLVEIRHLVTCADKRLITENSKDISNTLESYLERFRSDGNIAYIITDGVITIYHKKEHLEDVSFTTALEEIKRNFARVKTYIIKTPWDFIKPQKKICPGNKLFISEISYGTLGIFGKLKSPGSTSSIAISGGHVISENSKAFIDIGDVREELGTCIWPKDQSNSSSVNIPDISVIVLSGDIIRHLEIQSERIRVFDECLKTLSCRKVYKIGATTGTTEGVICDVDSLGVFGVSDAVLVTHCNPKESFSEEGDSGSIVLTKFGRDVVALGVIFGGNVLTHESSNIPKNASFVVSLKKALVNFENANEAQKIELLKM